MGIYRGESMGVWSNAITITVKEAAAPAPAPTPTPTPTPAPEQPTPQLTIQQIIAEMIKTLLMLPLKIVTFQPIGDDIKRLEFLMEQLKLQLQAQLKS
jgi:hypothetical protein